MDKEILTLVLKTVARGISHLSELNYTEADFLAMQSDPEFEGLSDEEFLVALRAITDAKASKAAQAEADARRRINN